VLRRFLPEDRDGFVEMNRDPGVGKYFPGLLTPEQSLGEMTSIEEHWDTHGFGPWALDVRDDFASMLGLKWAPPDMPFAPAVELLYRLIPRFWVKHWPPKARFAAPEFAFCEIHLDSVVAFAVQENTGSRRVLEKVGMVYGSDFDHRRFQNSAPCVGTFFTRSKAAGEVFAHSHPGVTSGDQGRSRKADAVRTLVASRLTPGVY
jgi:RimJ/RimL family protein N-acetyltransferase